MVPSVVNCPVLVTKEAVPEIDAEPEAATNRPVPPVNVSGPLNVMSGPTLVLVPVQVAKS